MKLSTTLLFFSLFGESIKSNQINYRWFDSQSVFALDKKKTKLVVGSIYYISNVKDNHVNLLLINQGKRSHYCLNKSLSKLLKVSEHHENIICNRRLNHFYNQRILNEQQFLL